VFIRIGLATGARHEAILALTWDQVDFETGRMDFRPRDKKGNILPETKKKRPHAPVSAGLMRYLKVLKKYAEGDHVVWHRGGRLKSVKFAFKAACKRAGLKGVTPHTMKHTYITWLLQAKQSVWDVKGLTNTSVETITRVYGHHIPDELAKAANAISFKSAEIVPK
jgi:integrase